MANRDLAKRKPEPEDDHTIWSELPQDLVEKCLSHLPVLEIASTLREVNKSWRDYPGPSHFMNLQNHGMNLNSTFGFLMYGTAPFTNRCETMTINHETLKWQMAPSLQLHGDHTAYKVESVSEGLILLGLYSANLRSFIVWNPLLSCAQAVPGIPQDYTNANLVVDRATSKFKIVAFSSSYRECLTYSPTTGSWQAVNYEGPLVHGGMIFPQQREVEGGHIAVSYKNCVYVAVESFRNDVHEIGDLGYDVERNAWKPAVMCRVPPATMELYAYCFMTSMFVVNDVMYKVVIHRAGGFCMRIDRPLPTIQILARSLAPPNNAGDWAVIASTVLPHKGLGAFWVGSWYACTLEGHEKPIICGLFMTNVVAGPLYMMMYDVGKSTWKKVSVKNTASDSEFEEADGIMGYSSDAWTETGSIWSPNEPKWKAMRMAPHYTPSWICPVAECTRHQSARRGRAHVGAV